jgi:CubicO group peptidase (beta-lactamase class C family)
MPRSTTAIVACCAAVGVFACAGRRAISADGFPHETWETASSPGDLGWSATQVAALKSNVDAVGSAAFMIITRGTVVATWGDTSRTFWTHSVRKSFMSALIGMAVAEGKIDLAQTLEDLKISEKGTTLTAVERQARVLDLLQARSGVYIPAAGEIDAMRDARPARGSHAPGTFWYYNNWDFNVLGSIFRRATGEDIFQAIDRRIAQPIGMQDYRVAEGSYDVEEQSEHPTYAFRVSARDLARFGLLYLHRGQWRGQQIVPAAWVDASLRSYSATGDQGSRATKSGYGYMWWIQANATAHPELRIPDGTFTASGNGGQRLTVIPQIETIIVNLMNTDEPGPRIGSSQWDTLVSQVLAARIAGPSTTPAATNQDHSPAVEMALVANAEAGTVAFVDVASRAIAGVIDVNPARTVSKGPGTPNYAQDTDVSPDGRTLYVSRGYLGDVAAFDIASGRLLWQRSLNTGRADHMTITADGRSLFVSALMDNRVYRIATATGGITGHVVTGVYPHDNKISKDGRHVYNTSLGALAALPRPADAPPLGEKPGFPFQLTITDVDTLQVRDRIQLENGFRPWQFTPDERGLYAQLSNVHGVVTFDLPSRKIVRRLDLPVKAGVTAADWDFEAPHHGLALTDDGQTLCLAARASDYAALVRVPELTLSATVPVGDAPGWAEVADGGRLCLTANARSDDLSILSVPDRKEIQRLPIGNGPKHITVVRLPASVLAAVKSRR